jgi:hypothetical protein
MNDVLTTLTCEFVGKRSGIFLGIYIVVYTDKSIKLKFGEYKELFNKNGNYKIFNTNLDNLEFDLFDIFIQISKDYPHIDFILNIENFDGEYVYKHFEIPSDELVLFYFRHSDYINSIVQRLIMGLIRKQCDFALNKRKIK